MLKLKKIIKITNIVSLFLLLFLIVNININQIILIAAPNNEDMSYKVNNMKVHYIYLEKEVDILNYLIKYNCYECFSSLTLDNPCYNGENIRYDLSWIIKKPPLKKLGNNNYQLMCIIFDKGIRDRKDDFYSLEDLKQMSNGADNMYIFWLKKSFIIEDAEKNRQNIKYMIFKRLEIELQKKKIEEINKKLNLLQKEKNDFKSKFLTQQLEISQLKIKKDNIEDNLKLKQQELLDNQKLNEAEITNLKTEIQNVQTNLNAQTQKLLDNQIEISQLKMQKDNLEDNLKLKQQEFLDNQKLNEAEITNLKTEIQNIQTNLNAQIQENIIKNQKIQELKNQLNLLKMEIQNERDKYQQMNTYFSQQKQQLYSGIFDLLYKKFLRF
ncbi:MAG: hypothetical protein Q8784_01655 [Vigna little leaf phytoplasma]|nr:hypothetical protein [Vigna little leaf phytoplasma]